jgi:site-specific recombinase XerC
MELGATLGTLSVNQHLAALKHWFDWLVTCHVLEVTPAHAVRGPRYSQSTGKTPIVEKDEARDLLASFDTELERHDSWLGEFAAMSSISQFV